VLGRIADVLMLDASERSAMFQLAVPELRSTRLEPAACELLEALRSLRLLGQKLWTATSEEEALALVREYGATQFASDLAVTIVRDESGHWRDAAAIGKPGARKRYEAFVSFPSENFDSLFVDALHLYPILVKPGEVLTRTDRLMEDREFSDKFSHTMDVVGWHDHDFMNARVRSKIGFVANIAIINETRRGYTDVEREHLSAIAQLVSHALSGGAPGPDSPTTSS
jgi:hypothetical protein